VLVAASVASARADSKALSRVADQLSLRWAPVYVQHVADDDRGQDRPTRIDFDGNWDATDNWDHQALFGTALPPAGYGAAILTATRAYLTYTLFYPRDWSDWCVSLICHDNDLESIQLIVERDGGDGRLVEVRTKAHHSMSSVPASQVARSEDGRPVLRVEAQGHGISVCRPGDPQCAPQRGRIIYTPGLFPSLPPVAAEGQRVTYELLSLRDTLWSRRSARDTRLWMDGETGPLSYVGARHGRLGDVMGAAMASNRFLGGVRPPWALAGADGKRGDWFLDPEGADPRLPSPYVYHPFLDDLAGECRGARCKPAPRERSRVGYYFKLGAPYVALALGSIVVGGTLRRHVRGLPF
jgi:hypothetical protein